jgi:exopolysaccharide production protein ExoQ
MDVMAMVLVVTLLAQVMPVTNFLRSLVHAGYVSMLLIVVSYAVQPSIAYGGSTSFGVYALPGLRGGFLHKNYMATALLLTLIVVLCFEQRRSVRQGLVAVITVLTVLSQSSTGLIALSVLLVLYWVLGAYPEAIQLLGRGFTVISLALGALGIFVLTILYSSIIGLFNKDTSLSGRTLLWDAVVEAIAARPITGYGWGGTFTNLAAEPSLSIMRAIGYPAFHSHNVVLELMIRLGAVGLILYVWLFVAAMRSGWKLLQRGHLFGKFVLMFGTLVLIFGVTEADVAFGVWYGLLCAVYVIGQRELNAGSDERQASGTLYRRASGIRP